MKLFERTGGHWLFWTGAIYFVIGMIDVFLIEADWSPWLQVAWLAVISSPFLYPPLGRWLNMSIEWDRKMSFLSFLGFGKMVKDGAEVLDFPKPKVVPPVPEVKPPKEDPAKIFYRLGLTDNNRVAFSMGYSEITMNREGVQQMIDQLTFFQSQLHDEYDPPNDDPDGGEPVPVPEKKAA